MSELTRSLRLPPPAGHPDSAQAMMRDVLVALTPALAMAVFFFGPRALLLTAVSVVSCVLFEGAYRRFTHQSDTRRDLSACVTGLLLALSLPASAPYWAPVLGAAFAIVVVKQFYGGLGKNFMNPALAGRMLLATFPMLMTKWPTPLHWLGLGRVDAVASATPMSYLHGGTLPPFNLGQLLLGGGYLVLRRVISPRISLAFLATAAFFAALTAPADVSVARWVAMELLSGGLLLGALFMATDPTTSPITPRGQLLFGAGCGTLTMLLRTCSSYPEGVGWAILTMNCCVWLLDRLGMPRRFGAGRFYATRKLLRRIRHSVSKIHFVKPQLSFHFGHGGKAPGEDHLDQIRDQAKVIGHLCVVVLIMGAMIFFVHSYNDLDTARTEAELQTERLAQVMPAAASSSETPYRANGALSILAGYSAENELVGYCVEVQAQGFGGVITMEVGVDLNGQVTGVAVTSHKETTGVGARAMTPAALSRYVGRYGTLHTTGENAVDAVSGATATSNAITAGVSRALAIVANLDAADGSVDYVDGEV